MTKDAQLPLEHLILIAQDTDIFEQGEWARKRIAELQTPASSGKDD